MYYQEFLSGRDVSKLEFNELKSLDANSHNNYEFSLQSNKKIKKKTKYISSYITRPDITI